MTYSLEHTFNRWHFTRSYSIRPTRNMSRSHCYKVKYYFYIWYGIDCVLHPILLLYNEPTCQFSMKFDSVQTMNKTKRAKKKIENIASVSEKWDKMISRRYWSATLSTFTVFRLWARFFPIDCAFILIVFVARCRSHSFCFWCRLAYIWCCIYS